MGAEHLKKAKQRHQATSPEVSRLQMKFRVNLILKRWVGAPRLFRIFAALQKKLGAPGCHAYKEVFCGSNEAASRRRAGLAGRRRTHFILSLGAASGGSSF